MPKSMPIRIGAEEFPSKASAKEAVHNILNSEKYQVGDSLDENDELFITDLVKRHPDAVKKVGVGIGSIEIRINGSGGAKEFWIVRKDESETEFSYPKCIDGAPSPFALFKDAARTAIMPQKEEFKDHCFREGGEVTCDITGDPIERSNSHADHHPESFDSIVHAFIAENNINLSEIEFKGLDDGEWIKEFADQGLTKTFAEYHEKKATLRITSAPANLRKPRKA